MADSHVTTLADGRELGWAEFGDADGWPVLGFHGTPGSRRQICVDEADARAAGVRLIAPDRPGYGLSAFQPGRRLTGWAADVEELADHLGIGRYSVLGVSGGGPHALACAAATPERVASAATVGGAVPLGHPRVGPLLTKGDARLASLAQRCPVALLILFSAESATARRFPDLALRLLRKQVPQPDAEVLARVELQALFRQEMTRASRTTARAWTQDFELFSSEWGFDLGAIDVPVTVWSGDADAAVPFELARFLHEEIPGSVLQVIEGRGHLFVVDRLQQILRALLPT